MKKVIFLAVLTIPLMAVIIFTGYWSSSQKQKAAQTEMLFAKGDLTAAQDDANTSTPVVATPEEWKIFRSESELKIRDNEIRLSELIAKMEKQGGVIDTRFGKKIAILELQNRDMKARLESYEKIRSNWITFKREFNNDMVSIGDELKDLTVDNNK